MTKPTEETFIINGQPISKEEFPHYHQLLAAAQVARDTAPIRTPLDEAQDEFDNAFGEMDKVFTFWLDLSRAMANPSLDESDYLLNVTDDLHGLIVEKAYAVVRAHQRLEQMTEHPTFPFDSLDEGYFCGVCGYVDEDTIELLQTPPAPADPPTEFWSDPRANQEVTN